MGKVFELSLTFGVSKTYQRFRIHYLTTEKVSPLLEIFKWTFWICWIHVTLVSNELLIPQNPITSEKNKMQNSLQLQISGQLLKTTIGFKIVLYNTLMELEFGKGEQRNEKK